MSYKLRLIVKGVHIDSHTGEGSTDHKTYIVEIPGALHAELCSTGWSSWNIIGAETIPVPAPEARHDR